MVSSTLKSSASSEQGFIRAVEIDNQFVDAWYNLGVVGGGSVIGQMGGQRHTKQQCYIRAIEIDGQYATAWYCLGVVGGGSVGGQQYTAQQCYIKALEIDDRYTTAWYGLGHGNLISSWTSPARQSS